MARPAKETFVFPRLGTVDAKKLLSTTPVYLNSLIKQRIVKRGPDGKFDAAELVHDFQKHREAVLKHKWTVDGSARARLAVAKAALAELELKQREGILVKWEDAAQLFVDSIAKAKTRLLAIPSRVAPKLATMKNMTQAKELIEGEILSALVDLSKPPIIDGAEK